MNNKQAAERVSQELTIEDLRSLLCFAQNAGPKTCSDLERVRSFLKSILHAESRALFPGSLQVFLEYLRPLSPDSVDEDRFALPDIFRTWTFSSRFDDIRLFTTCTALLADILEILGSNAEVRPYGNAVCQTLLLNDHFFLINNVLAASKTQGSPIVACLRLCTQLISFDGGIYGRTVYRKGRKLFTDLETLLILKSAKSDSKLIQRSRSIRHHSVLLLMASLRVQDSSIKKEMFSDGKIARAIFQFIEADETEDQIMIMRTMKRFYYSDKRIPRSSKSRALPEIALMKVLSLYDKSVARDESKHNSVAETASDFLLFVCCTLDCGALVPQNDWYLSESEDQRSTTNFESRLGTFDNEDIWRRFASSAPVKNIKLAQFLQELKPYRKIEHQDLALHIFRAAPELIADYFLRKKSFGLQPKLTATWIGYIGFLIAVAKLDLPHLRESGGLPNPFLVLENVFPSCLSPELFGRCLANGHVLVRLLISKLMSACLLKLQKVLYHINYHEGRQKSRWNSLIFRELQYRCPEVRPWSTALKSCAAGQKQLKEILIQVITQYHQLLPPRLLGVRLEVPILIADSLITTHSDSGLQLEILNIEHLSRIALLAPVDLDWFRRPGRLPFSPFVTALRIHAVTKNAILSELTDYIVNESFAFRSNADTTLLNALVTSLQSFADSHVLFSFLDDCFTRLIQRPTKFEGDVQAAGFSDRTTGAGLLLFAILDQLPHFTKKSKPTEIQVIREWIFTWVQGLVSTDREAAIMQYFLSKTIPITRDQSEGAPLAGSHAIDSVNGILPMEQESSDALQQVGRTQKESERQDESWEVMESQTKHRAPGNDFPQLNWWSRKDVVDAVEEGDIAALVSCLCADDASIRKQSLAQLRILSVKVLSSSYTEKQQLYLLLMELIETASSHELGRAFPAFAVAFAQAAIVILHDPVHKLYAKVNNFLIKAPVWNTFRMVSYWKDKIFAKPPQGVDDYMAEADWFLRLLIDGLQTEVDMDIYRRQGILEVILLRYDGFTFATKKVTNKLLWRCSHIQGGSTTLLTRCGFNAWAEARDDEEQVRILKERILATCDKARIQGWKLKYHEHGQSQ